MERLNAVYNRLLTSAGVNMFEGRATIVAANTVRVALAAGGSRDLTADRILIATGGRAVKAAIPGGVRGAGGGRGARARGARRAARPTPPTPPQEHAITSDEALTLPSLPPTLPVAVVGGGYIALEFAGIFAGLGAAVHVLYRRPLPLAGFDDECRAHVATCLAGRGIAMHAGAAPTRIEKNADGSFQVHYLEAGAPASLKAGLVMFGTGRAPNTAGLGLDTVGVETDPKTGAIVVDAFSRTTCPGVWAIGDVTDRMNLTPVALMEAMAFCESAFGPALTAPNYDRIATAVFVQPPMAACGLTEEAAVAKTAGPVDVYVSTFRPMRNTLSGRGEATLMKLIVDGTSDAVLGAHMVGPDAAEIMQGIAVALRCGARKADFDATVGIHPTAAEEFVTMRSRTRRVEGKGGKA